MYAWLLRLVSKAFRLHAQRSSPDAEKGFKFGHQPNEPDDRDLTYARTASGADLPASVVLSDIFSSVKNQDPESSCVAHAAVLAFEMELRETTGTEFNGSERQLYYDARSVGGFLPDDKGCRSRDALKVLQKQGLTAEKLCPYDPAQMNTPPTALAASFERFFRIKTYHINTGVYAAREEIAGRHPVIFNIPVYPELSSTGIDIKPPQQNEPILGYHEMTLVGYDDTHPNPGGDKGAFFVQNSWGTGWGTNGRAWIPYSWWATTLPGAPAATEFWSVRLQ
jgi:C1A family cysteine protease